MNDRLVIPPLAGLIALREVARVRSFTLAAAALGLTQGAVSKQVAALESFLGRRLVARGPEGLRLTADGAAYLADTAPLLNGLARAGRRLRRGSAGPEPVRVRGLAALSDRWLLPRFGGFLARHPDVTVEFSTQLLEVTRPLPPADLEFRYGDGDWTDSESRYLIGSDCALVAAPSFMARLEGTGRMRPGDALAWPRLAHMQAPGVWREYRALHGASGDAEAGEPMTFELYSVLISAAMNGFGAALAPRCLVETEPAVATLVNPHGFGVRSRLGYHVCWPRSEPLSPAAAVLVHWLVEEARRTEPPVAG